ncbi:integrase [Methylobacterium sp. OAE515]|uniref:tyrosine-type recombinase/integrase n=1 Tax=Methylobacterium sp. OAE515 TaxID=2817895 RepID=UPI001788F170
MTQLPVVSLADTYARQALSKATARAYRADWNHFLDWCDSRGVSGLPASVQTVCDYLASMAETHARATIERRLVTIAQAHKIKGLPWTSGHPQIRATLRGMFRLHGRPQVKAAAIELDEIRAILAVMPRSTVGLRDRAIVLLTFAGAMRRSEIARLQRQDVAIGKDGLRILLVRSKSDQTGEGQVLGIPRGTNKETCPVEALVRWLQAAPADGAIFRSIRADGTVLESPLHPNSLGEIVKKRASLAGVTTASPNERISAHGLRAGCITSLYRKGVSDEAIMGHSRHRDLKTMRGYVRRSKLMTESPVRQLGL